MNTRRPPIAPKSAQQSLGTVEGQQIVLEAHTPSPRKHSFSEHGNSLGATRPRSPRPADVYNAAMAELNDGDGRGLTKIRVSNPSPASSPSRRRAVSSITMSSAAPLNPLSPGRTTTSSSSILDHSGAGSGGSAAAGFKTLGHMTFSGVSGSNAVIGSASARVLSALDEHRTVMSTADRLSSTAPLSGTQPRKATSAPDSQSAQAQARSAVNPWRSGIHDPLGPLSGAQPVTQSPRTAAVAAAAAAAAAGAAVGRHPSPNRYGAPASPPLHGLHLVPVPPGVTGLASSPLPSFPVAWAAPPQQQQPGAASALPPVGPHSGGGYSGSSARQRRDSVSSIDSPSPGAPYESPAGPAAFGAALRVATLSRVSSPNSPSPSTPASSSQPLTPTCSSLKPRPPEAPLSGRGSRKYSHLVSPEGRPPAPQQPPAGSPAAAAAAGPRMLHSATTTPGTTPDDPPVNPLFRRSLSMSTAATGQPGAPASSQPGTPSVSRPTSGRASSARLLSRPVGALLDAVRSKDEGKLMEVMEALKGPHGVTQGLNDRHNVTGRTPLHEAVITNHVAMVTMLLAAGSDPNIGHITQGPPLLHCAAFGEVDTMRLLLKEGADVHATDMELSTALHFACRGGHLDAARLLLDNGGDMRARNIDDMSPLDLAPPEFPRLLLLRAAQQGAADADAAGRRGAAASPPLPSPPLLGRSYHRRENGSSAAVGASAAGGDGGVGVALSPERPSSSSSRPTSGTVSHVRTTADAAGAASAGGSRRSNHSGSGSAVAAGTPNAAAAAAYGPLCSPTSQIDLSISPAMGPSPPTGGFSLRPAPPMEPGVGTGGGAATAAANGVLRSRRNSSSALGAATGGADDSPLRTAAGGGADGSGGAAATVAATASTAAPSRGGGSALLSPQSGEGEAVPASPPQLQLPGGVRRQLSRGADLGDIISGFQKDDAEIVRRSISGTGDPLHPPHFHAPPGMPAGPSALAAKAKNSTGGYAGVASSAAAPAAGTAAGAPVFGRPTGLHPPPVFGVGTPQPLAAPQEHSSQKQKQQAGGGSDDSGKQQQQQPLLPFSMPETSVIRFGTRLQVHAAADEETAADASTPINASVIRQPSEAVPMPSFSAGMSPAPALAPAAGLPAASPGSMAPLTPDQAPQPAVAVGGTHSPLTSGPGGFSAVGFKPVPATGFTPPSILAAAGPAAVPQAPAAAAAAAAAKPAGAPSVATANRMSGSGEDFAAATPPLVRDDSPIRSRLSMDGTAPAAGAAGGAGGGAHDAAVGGSIAVGGRNAPTRTSMLAAKALKRMSNMNASIDAIEVRAAALFRQSTELTTGEMAWTRGELLGEGAYGKVYAGLNQQTGELMAVKVLQLVSKHGNKEAVMQQLEELEHEMSLYKKLQNKHVVGYIDARYDAKTCAFYIFLEYVPGGSIASMLNRFGRFSEELVRNYTRQLLIGLEYLHHSKIVHRDLKGGNVLVSRDGVVKLADFGASKAYRDHTITDCMKSVRGSVFWMAPEVIRGTGYGRRADIWSLGCTVIEMITGKHPWPHLDNQWTAMFTIAKTEEGPPRPTNLSAEGLRFLSKCLQFDPAKRPTATELLQDPFVARLAGGPSAGGAENLQHSF